MQTRAVKRARHRVRELEAGRAPERRQRRARNRLVRAMVQQEHKDPKACGWV